jgi:hypothetical protein
MKCLHIALVLGDGNTISAEEVANTFGLPLTAVRIDIEPLFSSKSPFGKLAQIYIINSSNFYKYTFVRIKNISELNTMFLLKYSDKIRFAISSNSVGIYKNSDLVKSASLKLFSYLLYDKEDKKIAVAPFIKQLEALNEYKVLVLRDEQ